MGRQSNFEIDEGWKDRFKEWRISQYPSQLAASQDLGISQNEISRIEVKTDPKKKKDVAKTIKPSTMRKLVAKGLNLNWLFADVGSQLIHQNQDEMPTNKETEQKLDDLMERLKQLEEWKEAMQKEKDET